MKKAKDKFDNLVERIKSGETVSFGQMEEVFAQGFLSKFLKRLSSEQEKSRANKFYREHLVDEDEERYEDEEQPELTSDQQIHYELEVARSVMGTLGVRPNTEDLSQYIEHAIRLSDWTLLGKVLSLTQEGDLQEGTLERIAVKELEERGVHSYKELKKQFPTIEVSSEHITPIYETAIREVNLEKLKNIKDETSIPILERACQEGYEEYLSRRDPALIKAMLELNEIAGVSPKKTKKIKEALKNLYQSSESKGGTIGQEELDGLNKILNIYGDRELSFLVQKAALEAGEVDAFSHVYRQSQDKLPERNIIAAYSRLDGVRDYAAIAQVMKITRVAPTRSIFSSTASAILSPHTLDEVRELIEIAGKNPTFEQEKVDNVAASMASAAQIAGLEELSNMGAEISDKHVYQAACRFIRMDHSSDFDQLEQKVNGFCKRFRLKPSPEVSAAKLSRLTGIIEENIESAVNEFTHKEYGLDPLTPIYRKNIPNHNKFKFRVKKLLKGYLSKAKKIKKENPELSLQRDDFDKLYSVGLEIALVQGLTRDQKYVGISELSDTLGITFSSDNVKSALYSHILRNYSYSSYNYKGGPEGLIARLNEAGLSIKVDGDMHNQVAHKLVSHGKNVNRTLGYLKELTGYGVFSAEVSEAARTRLVDDFANAELSEYGALVELAGEVRLSEYEKEKVSGGIVRKLKGDPVRYMHDAERIVEMTGVKLQADSWDLKEMVKKYFETDYQRTNPSQIARLVNQKLDTDQVFDRTIKLIHDGDIREAEELYRNTGIHPTEQGARRILDRYNQEGKRIIADRMNAVFGSNSGVK